MREELYSVTRDEYVGFVKQLIPQNMHTEHIENDDETASLKIYANRDDMLIAEQYLNADGIYEYYVLFLKHKKKFKHFLIFYKKRQVKRND